MPLQSPPEEVRLDAGPNLYPDWKQQRYATRWSEAAAGSLLAHIAAVALLVWLLNLPIPQDSAHAVREHPRQVTKLFDPPFKLTQKEPSSGKPSTELSVENLMAQTATKQSSRSAPQPALRKFQAPPKPGLPPANQTPRFGEPPALQAQITQPSSLPPTVGLPNAPPPPKLQTEEQPKLAFETPGQGGTASVPTGRIAPPKSSLDEVVKSVARGAGQGGISVGDIDPAPSLPDSLRTPSAPGSIKSKVDLLSDPMGVDFKPYLVRVLATVRRNWLAIVPESARLGRRGVVTLQFIVDRDGQVPKLVIAGPSGAEALDRAAVAGVSASVPLPPLPPEFKGKEVRLQFSFKYNVP